MRQDAYGQFVFNERDLMSLYMTDSDRTIKQCLVDFKPQYNLELENMPELLEYVERNQTIEEFDAALQSQWNMPEEYKALDIAEWVLDQCSTDAERQRVGEELLLYLDRNMFPLLQYLKYLVDTMRQHNIVWGVGRGSSVSSYVLYLIGVHKINSLYYDLDISEFLR